MKPTETIQVPIPNVKELQLVIPGKESLETMIERRQAAKQQIAALEKTVGELDITIGATLDMNHLKRVTYEGWVVSRREGSAPRQSLDRNKLLEQGVSPTVIKAATMFSSPGAPGVVVRKITDEKGEPN